MSRQGKYQYLTLITLFVTCVLLYLSVFHTNTLLAVSTNYTNMGKYPAKILTNYKSNIIKPSIKQQDTALSDRSSYKDRIKKCNWEVSRLNQDQCKQEQFINHTAIAVLIDWTNKNDINELKTKLLPSLQYLKPMNFILFSEHEANATTQALIRSTSHHKFHFIKIQFSFPDDFDQNNTQSVFPKRTRWGYMHMIRFWFKNIWLEPTVKAFKYILRFDTDSCLKGKQFSFPSNEDLVYLWSSVRYETSFITNLKTFILDYIKENNITVKNTHMFKRYNNKMNGLPMYYNNVEITSVDFMNRPEVQKFINAVDRSHGQYKYRWGDAPLRYATLAIFAEKKSLKSLGVRLGKGYQHPCKI